MLTLQEFFTRWNNQRLDFDGWYGDQCVDLADSWAANLGSPLPPVGGAVDFAGKQIAGYIWIPNQPSNQPKPGDIVIFGQGVGQYGHVDLAFDKISTASFEGFDQNWPFVADGTAVCHLVEHDYTLGPVLGWHHPHVLDPAPAPAPPPAPAPAPNWGGAVHWVAFSGWVDGKPSVNVRSGPSTSYPVIYTSPYGMRHNFDGFVAWGPGIPDAVTGRLTNVWFHISSDARKGWVASAEIYGDPAGVF